MTTLESPVALVFNQHMTVKDVVLSFGSGIKTKSLPSKSRLALPKPSNAAPAKRYGLIIFI